jgi:hypothetical protein
MFCNNLITKPYTPLSLNLGGNQFQPRWPLVGFQRWRIKQGWRLEATDDGGKELDADFIYKPSTQERAVQLASSR